MASIRVSRENMRGIRYGSARAAANDCGMCSTEGARQAQQSDKGAEVMRSRNLGWSGTPATTCHAAGLHALENERSPVGR
jgi:hypothetical protein